MFIYKTIKDVLSHPLLGRYTAFGIAVWKNGRELLRVSDVFLVRQQADRLAALCTRLQLDPAHLRDVIEDVL